MNNKKTITIYILSALTLILSFFSWRSVENAIVVPDSSSWGVLIISFFFLLLLFCLDIIFISKRYALEGLLFVSLFIAIIFTRQLLFIPLVLAAYGLIILAKNRIRQDFKMNIKVSIRKSLLTGFRLLLFGMAIVIASQYYFVAKNTGGERLIPKFQISKVIGFLTPKILKLMDPDMESLGDDMTIDQLIIEIEEGRMSDNEDKFFESYVDEMIGSELGAISEEEKNAIKNEARKQLDDTMTQISDKNRELILREGRKQFSEMTGFSVTGDEKVSDIFSNIINQKIDALFAPKLASRQSEQNIIVPAVMAIALFFTVWSIGFFFEFWIIMLVAGIFYLFVKSGILIIKKEMREVEIME